MRNPAGPTAFPNFDAALAAQDLTCWHGSLGPLFVEASWLVTPAIVPMLSGGDSRFEHRDVMLRPDLCDCVLMTTLLEKSPAGRSRQTQCRRPAVQGAAQPQRWKAWAAQHWRLEIPAD